MEKYNHKDIEKKWQKKWDDDKFVKIDKDDKSKKKYYILDMFPYPSGDGLHMGHTESYTASDVFYRFKKMQGFNVLHPQGFDAFGLPAENYAIKTGIHPAETTQKNIETYTKQMKSLGFAYDFDEQAITSDPKYYKWTQWIFEQFFKKDLVYKRTQKANWCESCQTVIANEQVVAGECERCGTEITQKEIPGWFFKITDFADDLIDGLDKIDWPEYTKKNQINWIGKSEGAKIKFEIKDSNEKIEVFTTRPDTLFGATYMVLAPEHPLIENCKLKIENYDEVAEYVEKTKKMTEMERIEGKEKTGVRLDGVKAINPANQEEIPVFIADYVLAGYGTGAIMAVPAHDERDFEFATKFGLDIKEVIQSKDNSNHIHVQIDDRDNSKIANEIRDIAKKKEGVTPTLVLYEIMLDDEEKFVSILNKFDLIKVSIDSFVGKNMTLDMESSKIRFFDVYVGDGLHIKSDFLNGLNNEDAIKKMIDWLESNHLGNGQSIFRLRDWSISRQRYWGCPIPIIYCSKCLENHKTQAPNSKQDTNHNDQNLQTAIIGEKEYAVILVPEKDLPVKLPGDVDFRPTGESPLKYSKSFNDVSCPVCGSSEDVLREYDTMDTFVDSSWYFLRYPDALNEKEFCSKERQKHWLPVDLYIGGAEHTYMHLLFARFFTRAMSKIGLLDFEEPFLKLRHQGMVLDSQGVKMSKSKGNVTNPDDMVKKFGADSVRVYILFAAPLEDEVIWNEDNIVGVYRFLEKVWDTAGNLVDSSSDEVKNALHKTIKKVSEDIEGLKYNTAISTMMKFMNVVKHSNIVKEDFEMFLKLLAPFAPHITEELWSKLGNKDSIHLEEWPQYDEDLAKDDTHTIALQVNGKVRGVMEIVDGTPEEEVKKLALEEQIIKKWIGDKEPQMMIYVKNRLLNIVL